jgi:quercetin dioxygenase-like cupin family protein
MTRSTLLIVAALSATTGLTVAWAQSATAVHAQSVTPAAVLQSWPGISRTDLQRNDLSIRGREVIQVRVDFQPSAIAPAHRHPGEEIVNVLAGSLEYQVEGRPAVVLRSGDVLFIAAGLAHSARNVGGETASELATYIVLKGQPLVMPAD